MSRGISVIMCCYNSKDRLPNTIVHIANQVLENIAWELIIVDNNSSDGTSQYALEEVEKYDSLLNRTTITSEKNPGLSNARMCGVRASQYDYIIFCDDDNWLEENYIQIAYEILENNIEIGALGGQSEAVSDVDFPDWWEDYKDGYAVGKQAEESGNISKRKYLWGAGVALRKNLFIKAFKKYPSFLTGRNGETLSAGDDSEICMRLLLMGYLLYYDQRLQFKHYIEPKRLTWDYRKNLFKGFEEASKILSVYSQYIDILNTQPQTNYINLLKNILKVLIALILKKDRFYTTVEANYIFFTTGITLKKTSSTARAIKKFKHNTKA